MTLGKIEHSQILKRNNKVLFSKDKTFKELQKKDKNIEIEK